MIRWLKENHELAEWFQAFGIVITLGFILLQISQARESLECTVENNEIALRNSWNDLLVDINRAALDHPEAAGDITGHRRLHLIRVQYFFRAFKLRQQGILSDDEWAAEETYLRYVGGLPDFMDIWRDFRTQYSTEFRVWADDVLQYRQPQP